MQSTAHSPTALSIAGSDPSGGAGIQADLKTFAAHRVYGLSVITALTAQNSQGVQSVHSVTPSFVTEQISALLGDMRIDAIKTGMLVDAPTIEAISEALEGYQGALIIDPVMISKNGHALLAEDAIEQLKRNLLPRCTILTPNLPEAACLLQRGEATDRQQMEEQAQALRALGPEAILLKGGHLASNDDLSPDCLVTRTGTYWLDAERVKTTNSHGTGCTLASAICAGIAQGKPILDAVKDAKAYLTGALKAADTLDILVPNSDMGQGTGTKQTRHTKRHGPLCHHWR